MEKLPFSKAIIISLLCIIALVAEVVLYFIVGFSYTVSSLGYVEDSDIEGIVAVFAIIFLLTFAIMILAPLISVIQSIIERIKSKE